MITSILISLFPVLLIGALQWLTPSLVPATTPFGVRIPGDRADTPVIAAQRRRYRLGTAIVTAAAAAGVILAAGHPASGAVAGGAEVVAGVGLYRLARGRIIAVKRSEDWFGGHRQVVAADTSLRTDPERYPTSWAVPLVLLLAGTVVAGVVEYPRMPARLATHFGQGGHADHYAAKSIGSVFGPVLTQALVTALLLVLPQVALRGRALLDAESSCATVRHRRFVSATARALLVLAVCVNVTFLFAALVTWGLITVSGSVLVAASVAPVLVGTAVVLAVALRTGQGGSRLRLGTPTGAGGGDRVVNRDDDHLYRWGLIYYNPDDPALFVPKRFGVGWTVNMARPLAWVLLAATVAAVALGPLLGSYAR
ncbi:DUF5808 domain-containing protein [Actinoallomurus purpureus]|uniref:DUF1648 domain-containing protein n=1 Tax=Actinoallomurus purpureus TaxID=478114 RepID=UPI002093DD18|nr:DUF5808 domain-containing protein [Actinoallomurus purpureus]MCO6004024.1 DUF5808 domain-containing protein [Actinoallomurus purpureus]